MHYLGIDAGASATKWALINENGLILSGQQEAMDGHLYRESSLARMQKVLREIKAQIKELRVESVYMGITGVTHDGSIQNQIKLVFDCDSQIVSDIELAYRANFSEGNGILLYAGTGSVSFAIDEEGQTHQIGGWGYLLGDEGAGYWIGRESIRHALSVIESNAGRTPDSLATLVLKAMNASDWNSVKSFVYSQERAKIAALSAIVNMAAEKNDADAILILTKAAAHLAELVNRMDKQLVRKALPVTFTGGISNSQILYRELERYLRMRVTISSVDIALRAAELAR
jgi:N-acetylglucosamine kinase-like BadF-type ATPase